MQIFTLKIVVSQPPFTGSKLTIEKLKHGLHFVLVFLHSEHVVAN